VLPQEITPPRAHRAKYFVEPNAQESPSGVAAAATFRPATSSLFLFALRASQWTVEKGLLNEEFRAASIIESNMVVVVLIFQLIYEE
jgi:hypothetical protein